MRIRSEKTLESFRRKKKCEYCSRPTVRTRPHLLITLLVGLVAVANWIIRGISVSLCWKCHASQHDGNAPHRVELLKIIAAREGKTPEEILTELYRILCCRRDRNCENQ